MDPTNSTPPLIPENEPEPSTPPQQELSEAQLREIYEAEEIERFLRLFDTHVEEVKLPNAMAPQISQMSPDSYSEYAAQWFLQRYLAPKPAQEFTLNRFRLAGQRLYLAIVPHYLPFILQLYHLATWEHWRTSATLCTGFWLLWWNDLLPAALPIYLLFVLLKHRFLPYPSLSELKQHREEIQEADHFGEQLYRRLSTNSFGIKDAWRLGNLVVFPFEEKSVFGNTGTYPPVDGSEPMNINGPSDSDEIQRLKRLCLYMMNETADFHERAKNIFIWRKPASSWLYCGLLVALSITTLLVPPELVLKTLLGSIGFFYWHITPVILSLPLEDRLRLPSPLSSAPNDFEYAMEMISQRIDAGLEISPSKFKRSSGTKLVPASDPSVSGSERNLTTVQERLSTMDRMGQAIDSGKSFLYDGKRFLTKVPDEELRSERPPNASSSGTLTFPAQHSSAPGIITLTPTKLYFTSLVSFDPKVIILLRDITSVKKVGLLKGLDIFSSAVDPNGFTVERQERFFWINNRDELFARIASGDNRTRWSNM